MCPAQCKNVNSNQPLSIFLQVLFKDRGTHLGNVVVVSDNFRGLAEQDAESSFLPERMSSASMPELGRWESQILPSTAMESKKKKTNKTSQDDISVGIGRTAPSSCMITKSPILPKRRTSLEDDSESDWSDDDDNDDDNNKDVNRENVTALMEWKTKLEALQESISAELDQRQSPTTTTKACKSPPRVPKRQSSLRLEADTRPDTHQGQLQQLMSTNKSIFTDKDLEREDAKVTSTSKSFYKEKSTSIKRRQGVVGKSSSMTSPERTSNCSGLLLSANCALLEQSFSLLEDIDEDVPVIRVDTVKADGRLRMFGSGLDDSKDSQPSCARRRPSPQQYHLDTSCSSSSSSVDMIPSCARRRPSPELEDSLSSLIDLSSSSDCNGTTHPHNRRMRSSSIKHGADTQSSSLIESMAAGAHGKKKDNILYKQHSC